MHEKTLHIIQRQTFQFNTVKQQSAYTLQERISKYCRYQLPDSLEKLFDQIVTDDIFIRLDKLEIDVGIVSAKKLEEELTEKITREVQKKLKQYVNGSGNGEGISLEKFSKEEMLARQFWFFLYNGYLSSWSTKDFFKDISEWLLRTEPDIIREKILYAINKQRQIADRLIYHFHNNVLARIFNTAFIEISPDELLKAIVGIYKYINLSPAQVREKYWLVIFQINQAKNITINNLLFSFYEIIRSSLITKKNIDAYSFFKILNQNIHEQQPEISSESKEKLIETLQTIIQELEEENQLKNTKQDTGIEQTGELNADAKFKDNIAENHQTENGTPILPSGIAETKNTLTESGNNVTPSNKFFDKQKDGKALPDDKAIYIDYAGIVLVHPFLNALYTEMELIKERAWIDEYAQQKAVQVLAYMAQEENYCPEYKMPLLKFLCGLEFEDFVSPEILLSEKEKALIEELLNAVIKYWSAIGKVSLTGLRESFLQREGKLTVVDKGWKLTVERKTIDILISKIPWGISFIKLPWLQQMLFVDWV